MKLSNIFNPPCPKCPYTLKQIIFVTSPCPQCKANNYNTYKIFVDGEYKPDKLKKAD